MRLILLTAALLTPIASAQTTIFDIPALPPGVSAPPAPAAPAAPAAEPAAPAVQAGPVAKVEIQEVEVTAPASASATPTVASDDVGEVVTPVLATDKDGNPVSGVEVTWEVKNTGKAPLYVISSQSGEEVTPLAATIQPGETGTYKTVTGTDGLTSLLLNATASTAAALKLSTSLGEVKNMRAAAQTIDWIGQ